MKKIITLLVLVSLFLVAISSALAVTYPVYGKCIGEKVNVRVNPDNTYPSYGRLIHDAPVTVLGELGDSYQVSTAFGKGYVPKMYIELFEGMTYQEFKAYSNEHPSVYRKVRPKKKNTNEKLLEQYYKGNITEKKLLEKWQRDPKTGDTGLVRNDQGILVVERSDWWRKPGKKSK